MNIDIIGSGSSGNCIILDEEVMIDAGVPYKTLKEYTKPGNIRYVLLTHIHGDHFNKATIRKLTVNTETMFLCGDFLKKDLLDIGVPQDKTIVVNNRHISGEWKFFPVSLYHDVPNIGWRISKGKWRHFHATDTFTLEGITAKNYDSATIECNHHLPTAIKLIEEAEINGEFTHLRGAINSHLSVYKAIKFAKENNIRYMFPCHIGSSTKKEVLDELEKVELITKEGRKFYE